MYGNSHSNDRKTAVSNFSRWIPQNFQCSNVTNRKTILSNIHLFRNGLSLHFIY